MNGAAAAGLLSFLGGAVDKQASFHSWPTFGTSLIIFGFGIGFTLISSVGKLLALNFLSQERTPAENATKEELEIYLLVGDRAALFTIISAIALLVSLGLFAAGIYFGKLAIFG